MADHDAEAHCRARAQNGNNESLAECGVEFTLKRVDDDAGRNDACQNKGKLTGAVVVYVFLAVAERADSDEQEHDENLRD